MTSILTPVLALVCLSLLVWIWMYATRIPAMSKAGVQPQSAMHPGSLDSLPSSVRAGRRQLQPPDGTADHLLRDGLLYLSGRESWIRCSSGWPGPMPGCRVVHSLIQCTVNIVNLRFLVFAISTLVLMVMAVRAVLML